MNTQNKASVLSRAISYGFTTPAPAPSYTSIVASSPATFSSSSQNNTSATSSHNGNREIINNIIANATDYSQTNDQQKKIYVKTKNVKIYAEYPHIIPKLKGNTFYP